MQTTMPTGPLFHRTSLGKRHYSVCASLLWNQPLETINTSTTTFKCKLKKYLLFHNILNVSIFDFRHDLHLYIYDLHLFHTIYYFYCIVSIIVTLYIFYTH